MDWPKHVKDFIHQARKNGYNGWRAVEVSGINGTIIFRRDDVTPVVQASLITLRDNRAAFFLNLDKELAKAGRAAKKVGQAPRLIGYSHSDQEPKSLEPVARFRHPPFNGRVHFVGYWAQDENGLPHIVRDDGKAFKAETTYYSPGLDVADVIKRKDPLSVLQLLNNMEMGRDIIEYKIECAKSGCEGIFIMRVQGAKTIFLEGELVHPVTDEVVPIAISPAL